MSDRLLPAVSCRYLMPAVVFFRSISTLTPGCFFSKAAFTVLVVSGGYDVTTTSLFSTAPALNGAATASASATNRMLNVCLFMDMVLVPPCYAIAWLVVGWGDRVFDPH